MQTIPTIAGKSPLVGSFAKKLCPCEFTLRANTDIYAKT